MHVVVSLLLLAAGVAAIAADVPRWYPACAGGRDSLPCLERQDHVYDFEWPADPWIPLGNSAELMGLSYALSGLALLGLFGVLLRPRWSWLLGLPFTAAFGVIAAKAYLSGVAGHPVDVPGEGTTFLLLGLGLPVALLTVAALVRDEHEPPGRALQARRAGLVLLALASPLALVFLGPLLLLYGSHDTTPWLQSLGGVLTVLAGVLLLAGRARTRPPAPTPVPTVGRGDPVAT